VIRHATEKDLPALAALGEVMHTESRFRSISFVPEKLEATLRAVMSGAGCVLVAERDGKLIGGFAGIAMEYFFSTEKMAADLALFIEPGRRGGIVAAALVRAFEDWARDAGAKGLELGVSTGVHPEKTGALYERLGFARQGALFVKEL